MKITTMSRAEATNTDWWANQDTDPCAVISISTPGDIPPVIPQGSIERIKTVINLQFCDIDPEAMTREAKPEDREETLRILKYSGMTAVQAIHVVQFLRSIIAAGINRIYVHCDAGRSRSRGVAAGLCYIQGLPDRHLYKDGYPNAWCKKMVIEAWRGTHQ
jgi:protein-tyrosine phosphatase